MPPSEYPPIGDYALIGDCHSAALVSRAGSIDWCCLPRFDSGSAFGRLLDHRAGGYCVVAPAIDGDGDWASFRVYVEDTMVVRTTFRGPAGEVELTDAFLVRDEDRGTPGRQLLRVVRGRRGRVELQIRVAPRFDYGAVRPWLRHHDVQLWSATGGNDAIVIWCEHELTEAPAHELTGTVTIHAGQSVRLSLRYAPPETIDTEGPQCPTADQLDRDLESTIAWWQAWGTEPQLSDRDSRGARRSALILKALTYAPTGAVVAAPTTSLPEAVGGERNWDYRYAWIRDSSFSSRSFALVGCQDEANAFRAFIMRSAAGHADDLQVLYGIGGERRVAGEVIDGLEGYRGSAPVRVGNDARGQKQLDAYGEIINLSWRWHQHGHSPTDDEWRFLVSLIDRAAEQAGERDRGIWEWPGQPQHFVHSKVMCWAALDRGLRLARECLRQAPTRRWTKARDELRETIERRGFDRSRGVFRQVYDRNGVDAALLLLPTVEFVAWDDPRMLRTVEVIRQDLDAGGGLLRRYVAQDGLAGREGAFLCCSFWLVECLTRGGDVPVARELFEQISSHCNDIGLFSEEVDPSSGELLGNFPQALTHLAHIDAAVALSETESGP